MPAGDGWRVGLEVVRVVDDKSPRKSAVRLQRKPIEQGNDGGAGGRFLGQRFLVSILNIVRQRSGHLSAGAKDLDLLALDKSDIGFARLPKRANLGHGETNQKRVIGDLLDVRLGNHSSVHPFDKADNPVPGRVTLFRILPIPELDFTWRQLLTVLDALTPVFEYPRFLKTILDTPVPHRTKLLKEGLPSPQIPWKPPVGQPRLPERNHLPQGILIGEDHEYTAPESLVRPCLAIAGQGEEVVIRRNFFSLDLGEPLHSRYCFHGANELVYRSHRLQYHHFLGDDVAGLHLQPQLPLFQRLLQALEERRQPFGLALSAWTVELPATTTPLLRRQWFSRTRENQQRTFRHR